MMEFDIINEILTATVAQLFTNKQAHSKYFKTSRSIHEERNELPSGARVQNPLPLISTPNSGQSSMQIIDWLSSEGRKWLEGAFERLSLDKTKVSGKYLNTFSLSELNYEKRKVKNELKHFDSNFIGLFGRTPERKDKEPMRPLYMYYKKLKQCIDKRIAMSKAGDSSVMKKGGNVNISSGSAGSNISVGYSSSGTEGQPEPMRHTVGGLGRQTGTGGVGGAVAGGVVAGIDAKKEESPLLTGSGITLGNLGKIEFKGREEIVRVIKELKIERGKLRTQLDQFQKDFIKLNNRKIKYNKDIAPCAAQFQRYKELKKIIAKIEEKLTKLK